MNSNIIPNSTSKPGANQASPQNVMPTTVPSSIMSQLNNGQNNMQLFYKMLQLQNELLRNPNRNHALDNKMILNPQMKNFPVIKPLPFAFGYPKILPKNIPIQPAPQVTMTPQASLVPQTQQVSQGPSMVQQQQLKQQNVVPNVDVQPEVPIKREQPAREAKTANKTRKQTKETTENKTSKMPKIPKKKEQKPQKSSLEKQLDMIVDVKGGIAKPEFIPIFIKTMTKEKSEQGRLRLAIALFSSKSSCLKKFLLSNGLNLLNEWIGDLKNNLKSDLLKLLLKILLKLPISISTLKSSGIGKTVNKLNRQPLSNEIKTLVTQLMDKWKKEVREKSKTLSAEDVDGEALSKIKKIPKKSSGIFSEISGIKPAKKKPEKENSIKPDYVKDTRRSVQAVELDLPNQHKRIVTSNTYTSKPMSADDIKKQQRLKKLDDKKVEKKIETNLLNKIPPLKRKIIDVYKKQQEQTPSPPAKKKKKSVSWAPDHALVQVREFEVESIGNVKFKSISAERADEKKHFEEQRRKKRERLAAMKPEIEWYQPIRLNFNFVERGKNSTEIRTQTKRIFDIEEAVYLNRQQIPPSPASPVREPDYNDSLTKIIPFKPPQSQQQVDPQQDNVLQQLVANPQLLTQLLGLFQQPQGGGVNTEQNPNTGIGQPMSLDSFGQPHQQTSQQQSTMSHPYQSYIPTRQDYKQPQMDYNIPTNNMYQQQYQQTDPNNPLSSKNLIKCKFYGTKIGCRNGNSCGFLHEGY